MTAPDLIEVAAGPMAVIRTLNRMRCAGVTLTIEDDRLIVTADSQLSDAQRAFLRARKAALVQLLTDAKTLYEALQAAGTAGLGFGEGTPDDWPDTRLLAAGEVLYHDGRMVNRLGRRYATERAPVLDLSGYSEVEPADDAEVQP